MLIIKKPKLHINILKIKLFTLKYLEMYFGPTVTCIRYFRSVLVQNDQYVFTTTLFVLSLNLEHTH